MARKKAAKPPIVNGLEDDYIVEKSRPLMLMKEVPFALGELKVLDTYLSRINARDPDATTVRFSKEEYEDLMGIERMRPERLDKYVTALHGKVVKVPDETASNGWRNYSLFDESGFEQDENGQWWIDLCCTTKAKNLFFNIEGIGYIRYQLKNVLPLTSKYSVLLYIYLLDNRFRKSWTISLDELRATVFRCNEPLYDEYKYLNQRILKKCIEEINSKTDLTFEYEPIRVARKVVKIKFNLVKDEVILPEPSALERPQLPVRSEGSGEEYEQLDLLGELNADERERRGELCCGFDEEIFAEFSLEQLKELKDLAWAKADPDAEERHYSILHDRFIARQYAVTEYIRRKILLCNAQKDPVVYRYNFIKRAVDEDWR